MDIGDTVVIRSFDEIIPSGMRYCTEDDKAEDRYLNLSRESIDEYAGDEYTVVSIEDERHIGKLYHLNDMMWVFTEEMLELVSTNDAPEFIPDEELTRFLCEVIM